MRFRTLVAQCAAASLLLSALATAASANGIVFDSLDGVTSSAAFAGVPIPTKPPVFNGMIAPRDSWMMPPPCNEMIPPGAPRLLA